MTDTFTLAAVALFVALVVTVDVIVGHRLAEERRESRGSAHRPDETSRRIEALAWFKVQFRATAASAALGVAGCVGIEYSSASPLLVFIAAIGASGALHGLSELADSGLELGPVRPRVPRRSPN
jgi:hypothetical protein